MNDEQLANDIRRAFARYTLEASASSSYRRPLLRRIPALGRVSLAGVAVALVAILVLNALPGPAGMPPSAFAGWVPVPGSPDPRIVENAKRTCFNGRMVVKDPNSGSISENPNLYIVLQDQRGHLAFIVAGVKGFPNYMACLAWANPDGTISFAESFTTVMPDIGKPIQWSGGAGDADTPATIIGTATGASRVLIERTDGLEVEATVRDGVFGAWWPGRAWIREIRAYDAAGNLIAALDDVNP